MGVGRRPFSSLTLTAALLPVAGETLIPYFSGRVIDILGGDFDPDAFASAIFFMSLVSVGR